MNQQREVIYSLRRDIMTEADMEPVVAEFRGDVLDDAYSQLDKVPADQMDEARQTVMARLADIFNLGRVMEPGTPLPEREVCEEKIHEIFAQLQEEARSMYQPILRYFLLEELDRCWKEHLRNMDALRDGIGLRGYGQKDPKLEYKREGFEIFQNMLFQIREGVFRTLTRVHVQPESREEEAPALRHREEEQDLSYSGGSEVEPPKARPARARQQVGRNDLCPCGSGRKYKRCCGVGQ